MKKNILNLSTQRVVTRWVISFIVILCSHSTGFSQGNPKPQQLKQQMNNGGKTPINTKILSVPGNLPVQNNSVLSLNLNGGAVSVDGYNIDFITPNNPLGSTLCGAPYPVVQLPQYAKNGSCPFDVPCDNPVNRDANIPTGATPVKFMQLRWTVVRDGAGSPASNIDMTRVNNLMTELNNDCSPWKIQFCLDTVIFQNSTAYYEFDAASEEPGMKSAYGANFINVINIYVVNNITNPSAGGYAYFPYSGYGGTNSRGGVVMSRSNSTVGTHTLAHELGHTFGLHHTFHGVDEVSVCSACYENVGFVSGAPASGNDHGDRCSDTYPHETNSYSCVLNPGGKNVCDAFNWANVPVNNHMSYSFCSSQFTSQQAGRMHCMINTYIPSWVNNGAVTCGSQPPVADFSGSPLVWPAPANVNFTNLTAGKATVTSWSWNFDVQGVGGVTPTTSTLENPPTVTYSNPGLYRVRLIAVNANGTDTADKVNYIQVTAPIGDCDTLFFQWNTPTSTATYYSFDASTPNDSLATGVPCRYYNALLTDSLELFERFSTPTPGSTKVGGVRLGMGFLADTNDNMTIDVAVYNDNGAGKPNYTTGYLGGVNNLSPTTLGFPGAGFYAHRWVPFNNAVTIPGSSFHIGVKITPGNADDTLIMISSQDLQGEGDSSNHVLTTNFGLIDYQNDHTLNFDLAIIPLLGEYAPYPVITQFTQIADCDSTTITIFDTAYYSTPVSWEFTFSDGTTYTDTVDPKTLVKTYFGPGPDTVTITAVNSCGKIGANTYIIPYNFNATPSPDFTKNLSNPICLPPPTSNCATFTATPANMFSYTWNFGDGTSFIDTSAILQYCFSAAGSYYVELSVTAYGSQPVDTLFYQNFNAGMPVGFSTVNLDALNPVLNPPFNNTNATAWVANNSLAPGEAISTSWYNPIGTSNDWMITSVIALNANSSLYWEARNLNATFPDGYEVRISTTTQTTAGCLANPALFSIAAENAYSSPRSVDLAAAGYANQSVYICFRNNSTDQYILAVDDILVGSSSAGCSNTVQKVNYVDIVNCSITPPTASMLTSSPTTGCDSVTVTFTDNSTGTPTSWLWDFNDGTFSTMQNPPPHTYSTPGTYYVRLIVSNNGGTDTAFYTINVYATPASPTAGTNATYCQGTMVSPLTATGVSIQWFSDPALTILIGSGSPFTPTPVVGTNTYYVTQTVNGCKSPANTVVLTVNQAATASAGADASVCAENTYTLNGSKGGSATTSTWSTTGNGTFDNISIVTATYTPSATDISMGSVTLTITTNDPDGAGPCPAAVDAMVLTINTKPIASIISSSNISCNGGADGSASSSAASGTIPYTYSWNTSPLQTGSTATGLSVGAYNVIISDSNSCSDTAAVTLTQPLTPLSGTTGSIDASCGNADGFAYITASGGTGPYSYQWNDPLLQTNDTASGLFAGNYNVTLTDNNTCVFTAVASVNDGGAPVVTITNVINVSCNGGSDGSATVNAAGGVLPYTYSWSTGGNSSTGVNMPAGTHSATVTDSVGCVAAVNVTITQPSAISITSQISVNISCNGLTDGSINLSASGGTGTLSYSIDSGFTYPNTTGSFSGLSAGSYPVAVKDSNNCIQNGSTLIINNPSLITINSETAVNSLCNGTNDGTITVTASGGTGTLNYSIDSGLTFPNTTGIFANLGPGNYGVQVKDSNSCVVSGSLLTLSEPGALVLTTGSTASNCGQADGVAYVTASGGNGGFNYQWSDPGNSTSDTVSGLLAGTYNVTVTDIKNCMDTAYITISDLAGGTASSTVNSNAICNGYCNGQATVSIAGGSMPFTYLWNDLGNQTGATAIGLCAGNYTVNITDGKGCVLVDSVTVSEPAAISANTSATDAVTGSCTGTITVTASGGTGSYTYLWDDGQTTSAATGFCSGSSHSVTVTDANGCTGNFSDSVGTAIGIMYPIESPMDIAIYPNPTGGIFLVEYSFAEVTVVQVSIYNNLGEVILENVNTVKTGIFYYDLSRHADGIYYAQFKSSKNVLAKKISLIK